MDRIGIRELRNHTGHVVRRAMSGERIVVTVNGIPAAQLGPLGVGSGSATTEELVAGGLLRRPRSSAPAQAARPIPAPPGVPTTAEVLREQRDG